MTTEFDVIVIGGGPGGYVAAIRAAQLGLRTALVERRHLGGICLNWGCIPTKAMLAGAELAHRLGDMARFGFSADNLHFDLAALVAHSRAVSSQLSGGVAGLLKKNGVQVLMGEARLTAKEQVCVSTEQGEAHYRAPHIILATGARPRTLPGLVPDGAHIWNHFHALSAETLPASLLVIGSGAIGTEFASLYRDLGSEVTLVEMAPRIMPVEDEEISATVQSQFQRRGIQVRPGTRVSAVEPVAGGVRCLLQDGQGAEMAVVVERVLVAVGVQGNVEGLGLEALGVEIEGGFVRTDARCRTSLVGLYAIGDVAGAPCLAHKASHEGMLCVEALAGVAGTAPLVRERIPACTYGRPQVASIGLSEAAARAAGLAVRVGRFPLQANGKALAMADAEGFVKVVFEAASGELLGAHMVGPEVTEQIQGFAVAANLEATDETLAHTIFPHPSLSEAMHEAVLAAMGRALHR